MVFGRVGRHHDFGALCAFCSFVLKGEEVFEGRGPFFSSRDSCWTCLCVFQFLLRCIFFGIFNSGVALFVFSCVVPIFSHDMGHNDVVSCAVASRVAGERFARFVFVSFSVAIMVVLQFKPIVCSSVVAQVLSCIFFALDNLPNESTVCPVMLQMMAAAWVRNLRL